MKEKKVADYKQNLIAYKETVDVPAEINMPDIGAVEFVLYRLSASASEAGMVYVEIQLGPEIAAREYGQQHVEVTFKQGLYFGVGERPIFKMGGSGENPPPGTKMAICVYGQVIDRDGSFTQPSGLGGYFLSIRSP